MLFDLISIDWNGVWNIVNSNVAGLVISAIMGVLLASFIQWRREITTENRRKKGEALLIGLEIAQMKQIVISSSDSNKKILEEYKRDLGAGERYFLLMPDIEFSRTIYDKPTTDLSLLPSQLAATISDIYRRAELCNRLRKEANQISNEGNRIMPIYVEDKENEKAKREIDKAANQYISYAQMLFANLDNLSMMCDEAIKGLSEIPKVDTIRAYSVMTVNPDAPLEGTSE